VSEMVRGLIYSLYKLSVSAWISQRVHCDRAFWT